MQPPTTSSLTYFSPPFRAIPRAPRVVVVVLLGGKLPFDFLPSLGKGFTKIFADIVPPLYKIVNKNLAKKYEKVYNTVNESLQRLRCLDRARLHF